MSVYEKNNHCLPISLENLNLIFLIFLRENEKSISGVFLFSILYFTSIHNVHLKIYNSSINNMFTH